jgi:hypothetical protein
VSGVACQVGEPAAERGDDGVGQQTLVQGRLGNDEQRRTGQAVCGEHLLKMRRDVVLGARRYPVEQHRQRGAALLGGLQDVPRHGVGVAGGGGDEQPQVGCGEQLRREPPVRGHDGVDVRGVEEGEPRDQRR